MLNFQTYNTPKFKKILCSVYKLKEIDIFPDQDLCLLCPFFISRKCFKKNIVFNMPFNFYYSPNLGEYETMFFENITQYSEKSGKNVIVKSLADYKNDRRIISCLNSFLTLDFDTYESYFKSLSKSFRQNIRTARNKLDLNAEIREISSQVELKRFYKTMSVLYVDKHKMVFQPFALFEQLVRTGLAKILAYVDNDNGKVLSAIVFIFDNNIIHYCWGISDPLYYRYSLNTLLVDELIKNCIDRRFRYIDFGSTPTSDDNLLFFKEKWGCSHHPVYHYYSLHKPVEVDLNQSYLWARNIYSKLPKQFIRLMMPKVIPWLVS